MRCTAPRLADRRNASTRRVCHHDRPPGRLRVIGHHRTKCPAGTITGRHRQPARGRAQFTSRHYGYTEALPAGWTGVQATHQWNGTGAPGDTDSVANLFQGPGGVEARAIAAPTKENLAAYTRTTTRAA